MNRRPQKAADMHNDMQVSGTISDLFEAQVQRTPHAIAAEYAGACLTYRNLKLGANRFAYALANQGEARDSIVGIGLQRSLELPIALFGVLKAGGVCMPLDPEYPPERLAYRLDDARAEV